MPDRSIYKLHAEICKTFSNPKRLEIIDLLRDGEKSVNELAESMGFSQANISQHLAILRQRRIVDTRREGVNIYYNITDQRIVQACQLLRDVLLEQLAKNAVLAKQFT
ncbi:MAG: ArsR/SmtB family transcription factor [Candidatus Bathyarchaeia archaeon]